jgi:acyl-CoA thioesterase FadM
VTEFRWLDRLKIDLRQLLHTDQEYEYFAPLREGDPPLVCTRLAEYRERLGLLFVCLESAVRVAGKVCVTARSTFVVRKTAGEAS